MRRIMAIFGVLVIAVTVIISGSAVAVWHYGDHVEAYYKCTSPDEALGAPDCSHASLGVDTPVEALGWIIIDLGSGNEMGSNQTFGVYSSSAFEELYNVTIFTANWQSEYKYADHLFPYYWNDTWDHEFTTPTDPGTGWRYIRIDAITAGRRIPDTTWGPEIDAVGWWE